MNDRRRYTYIVFGRNKSYFVKNNPLILSKTLKQIYHVQNAWVFDWLEYLLCSVDLFSNRQSTFLWVQTPFLSDLCLYSYKEDFIQGLLQKNEKKLSRSFNFTFHYIDDVLSLNSSLRMFYGRHHDLVNCYGVSVSQMTTDMFCLS
jgi:hypothetical protein